MEEIIENIKVALDKPGTLIILGFFIFTAIRIFLQKMKESGNRDILSGFSSAEGRVTDSQTSHSKKMKEYESMKSDERLTDDINYRNLDNEYAEFSINNPASIFAFESILIQNNIKYIKQDRYTRFSGNYFAFYVKKNDCVKIADLIKESGQ